MPSLDTQGREGNALLQGHSRLEAELEHKPMSVKAQARRSLPLDVQHAEPGLQNTEDQR